MHPQVVSLTYRQAGVDIDKGEALVERIRPLAAKTTRPEVLGSVGGFAGLCSIPDRYSDPILVSGTDGVGTKLTVAHMAGNHRGIGIDLVAMAVNDIITVGAEPLFFLDYFATGRLDVELASEVIAGIAQGCSQAGCALLGGETAELPGLYNGSDYDLAGFTVGVVERSEIITGDAITPGDVVIGLASSGLHSNGFSLARRALFEELALEINTSPDALEGQSLGDAMLAPTTIYVNAIAALKNAKIKIHGVSHITGGGLIENPGRMFSGDDMTVRLYPDQWQTPAIFELISSAGVESFEMRRTFNMGLGLLVVVPQQSAERACALLSEHHRATIVGDICERSTEPVEFIDP